MKRIIIATILMAMSLSGFAMTTVHNNGRAVTVRVSTPRGEIYYHNDRVAPVPPRVSPDRCDPRHHCDCRQHDCHRHDRYVRHDHRYNRHGVCVKCGLTPKEIHRIERKMYYRR
ncbi:MAG: hypothetical protein ACI3Y5_07520 [Prevotella sp.]